MLRIAVLSAFIALSGPAHAVCFQRTGFDFADSVNKSLDHLICLHNEQVNTLNEHADVLNRQAKAISVLELENDTLRRTVSDLESQLSSIESRVGTVESR